MPESRGFQNVFALPTLLGFVSDCVMCILLILYISVSLNQPARVLGLFLSSYLSEKLGRKRCLVLCSLAQLLSR